MPCLAAPKRRPAVPAHGLTTVCAIVKALGGGIMVSSEPGAGTTFRVLLPRTDPRALEASMTPERDPVDRRRRNRPGGGGWRGDPGAGIRQSCRATATACWSPRTPTKPVEMVRSAPRIDLVLTDVMMPDGSGPDLIARLRTEKPIRALYMSGYAGAVLARQGQLEGDCEFLQKPFTGLQLVAKASELINRSAQ